MNGQPLDPRRSFRSESATTFDWGYGGRGGPTQLALAILFDHFADDERTRRHYEGFTRSVIQKLPTQSWTLTTLEISDACAAAFRIESTALASRPAVGV